MPNYQDYYRIIQNIIKTSESDIVINFGINNYVSKIFIEEILDSCKEKFKKYEVEKIYLNANIHSSEDYILKKICRTLGLNPEKNNFDKAREEIEEYYKEYKKQNSNKFLIIIFENIENLFFKKKQTLFYTLLEIVNLSSNCLFCGITSNFNIMDLMEKRVRSRFSQKTININLKEEESFFYALEDFFYEINDKNKSLKIVGNDALNMNSENGDTIPISLQNGAGNNIYGFENIFPKKSQSAIKDRKKNGNNKQSSENNANNIIVNTNPVNEMEIESNTNHEKINMSIFLKSRVYFNNPNILREFYKNFLKENKKFIDLITHKINMGCGIKEIIIQLKYLLTIFLVKLRDKNKDDKLFLDESEIKEILDKAFEQYSIDTCSSYKNMLKSKILFKSCLNFILPDLIKN